MTLDRRGKLDELLEEARKLPPMTEDQRVAQAMSWAYGQLACSTNHKPVKAAFLIASRRYGWSEERFLKWAEGKEWRTL